MYMKKKGKEKKRKTLLDAFAKPRIIFFPLLFFFSFIYFSSSRAPLLNSDPLVYARTMSSLLLLASITTSSSPKLISGSTTSAPSKFSPCVYALIVTIHFIPAL